MTVQHDVSLAAQTTFGVGGPARYFVRAAAETELTEALAWAAERSLPVFLLGGGSNLLVPDEGFAGLVVKMGIGGIQRDGPRFDVGAGVVWDDFVALAVSEGCAGIECLAGIPGSVGGTPVQNVGAYGQEVAETILSVRAFDRQQRAFVELDREACGFRYRESLFNTTERGRYIVTRVSFRLHPEGAPTLRYADLQRRFVGRMAAPSLAEVSDAVREIRRSKGMLIVAGDPDCRSAGSFFKNPVVATDTLASVAAAADVDTATVPHWPAGAGRIKLPAAWLLERAGFVKGYGDGPVGISTRHTLALVNRGGATYADVETMQAKIVDAVAARFGITLQREPVLLT